MTTTTLVRPPATAPAPTDEHAPTSPLGTQTRTPGLRLIRQGDGLALMEFVEAWKGQHPAAELPPMLVSLEALARPNSLQKVTLGVFAELTMAAVGVWQRTATTDVAEVAMAFVGPGSTAAAGPPLVRGLASSAWSCGVHRLVHSSPVEEADLRAAFRAAEFHMTTVYQPGLLRLSVETAPGERFR